ncbi:hypothetical protein E2C01_036660 [Portunus trituberculatus]|uniref:Uncharacterized protein n=1 Tax=Portunus trituberculatus TaxID=210409 RepID=A0A5B7FBZ3_PORTR|nr:hypothetical protein [Portunus trituberculatus]
MLAMRGPSPSKMYCKKEGILNTSHSCGISLVLATFIMRCDPDVCLPCQHPLSWRKISPFCCCYVPHPTQLPIS